MLPPNPSEQSTSSSTTLAIKLLEEPKSTDGFQPLNPDSAKSRYNTNAMSRENQPAPSCLKVPSTMGAVGCGCCFGVGGAVVGYLCCPPVGLIGSAACVPGAGLGRYILGVCDDKPRNDDYKPCIGFRIK